jgi:hypothetical protein
MIDFSLTFWNNSQLADSASTITKTEKIMQKKVFKIFIFVENLITIAPHKILSQNDETHTAS